VPGGTYFFTINLMDRGADVLTHHINHLRDAVRRTQNELPFHIDAWVVLPEHMYCVITLPEGESDFSNRIKAIEIRFVRTLPPYRISLIRPGGAWRAENQATAFLGTRDP
jgi:putative transposase